MLLNASYPSDFGPGGRAQLVNGEFVGSNPSLVGELRITLLDFRGAGQLDADASTDAAVILMSKTQGTTGSFYELVAVLNQTGGPMLAGPAFLGDRVIIHSVEIANRQITLKMRVQGPGRRPASPPVPGSDPRLCPQQWQSDSILKD